MAAVAELPTALAELHRREIALRPKDDWGTLPQSAKTRALLRQQVIGPVLEQLDQGLAPRQAAQVVWQRIAARHVTKDYLALVQRVKNLSAATLERWTRAYQDGGLLSLAPKNKGRQRQSRGWEARAAALFASGQHRYYATVALMLQQEGWDEASEHLVRRYLQSLPSNAAETSPKRLGAHYHRQNVRPHVVRDSNVLPVGFVYTGDGHCCDQYVAHPVTGEPFRPELTPWIDVRSHKVVSWWASEAESAQTTLFSLSQALIGEDHAPAFVHTDPGSGFKALLITDEVTGFLARFSIQAMFALPGNARGKGLVEGWFRWYEERCGKRFDTYCGKDRTDDALRRLKVRIARGELQLPTWSQWLAAVREYVRAYNAAPQDSLDGKSPDELWAQLERVPLETPAAAVVRPRETRTVRRWGVSLHNRLYRCAELQAFETREVIVEYCLQDDGRVWIHDLKGRYVAEALLVEKTPWLPASRIEEAQQKRKAGQLERLQARMDEVDARARAPITTTAQAARCLTDLTQPLPEAPASAAVDEQVHAAITEELTSSLPVETPWQRWARFQALTARQREGLALSEDETSWLASYPHTSEYRGLAMAYDSES
jgi:putative transposase